MENLSFAFYDYPDMVDDMVTHWAELCARQIEQLPSGHPDRPGELVGGHGQQERPAGQPGPLPASSCSPATTA